MIFELAVFGELWGDCCVIFEALFRWLYFVFVGLIENRWLLKSCPKFDDHFNGAFLIMNKSCRVFLWLSFGWDESHHLFLVWGLKLNIGVHLWNHRILTASKFTTVNRGAFTQNLKFKYFYKNHCKSYKLLWAFKGYHIL